MQRPPETGGNPALEALVDELVPEAQRYLEAIAVFREHGHEPRWRPERASELVLRVQAWVEPHESRVRGA